MPQQVEGVDHDATVSWLEERVGSVTRPVRIELIEGGRSNLTYHVIDGAGRRWVLRRPPLHSVLESAHDMGREHRIIAALQATDVPVPPVVGFEPNPELNGAPFYVMDYVDGEVLRDADSAERHLDEAGRAHAAESLIDVLVRLHAVDPDAVGLGDLGRREDYVARQLRRWHRQLQDGNTRDLPMLEEVHDRLAAGVPAQGTAAIVHGDYRLDNLMVGPDGGVRAVLDWELCTLGDPLADVGLLMVYWSEPDDDTVPLLSSPTTIAGFPSRRHVAERYAESSGRDLADLDFYIAFGFWKLAVILEGVFGRYQSGAHGDVPERIWQPFGAMVLRLGEQARDAAARAGR